MAITEYIRNVDRAILDTVFENTVRRVNKCLETGERHFERYNNFLFCNHQVHRDFLITLYMIQCIFWVLTDEFGMNLTLAYFTFGEV
jgi:hypothetical protein